MSDKEILQRYKISGKAEYLGELCNRYIPIFYGVALKYLQDADKAQDAVMHAFTEILPEICQLEADAFRTRSYSAMKNYCLQLSEGKITETVDNREIEERESDKIFRLFDENEPETEQKKALKQCLKKLPVEQRIAIIRFYTEEMSFLDIADSTGYNLKQVKSYIRNGKQNIKIAWQKMCK